VLQAGDLLYLPQGWRHAVVSKPLSIMTNTWIPGVGQL
jgi:ribosomal protein L16 Arg81 hydroxylase